MTHLLAGQLLGKRIGGNLDYQYKILHTRPDNLLALWMLTDAAGRICTDYKGRTSSQDLIENGGFETAGGGGADVFGTWVEVVGDGAIADEGVIVHAGSHAAKLTAGAARNTNVKASNASAVSAGSFNVVPGVSLTLTFWTRGDGTYAGRYSVYDVTNAAYIRSTVTTGVIGTDYTQVTYAFTIPAGCYQIIVQLWCPNTAGGIAYFDDASLVGNIPLTGVYQPSGIMYGQPGIYKTCTQHNGTDSGILIGNKAFGALWNGNVGSAIGWGKVDSADRWIDATSYRYPFHVKSRQNNTVYLVFGKSDGNHQLSWRRRVVDAAAFEYLYTFDAGPTGWFCQGMSWDVVSNPKKIKCYLYVPGVLAWTKVYDDTPIGGLDSWDNGTYTADNVNTALAGGSTTAQEWIGWCGPQAIWYGATLTDAEMKLVMTP